MSLGYLNTGMALLGYTLLLLISFYLLAFISNKYFISSLVEIAKKLKMSSDAAGATLMAAGSSAPELFIVIIAILKKGSHAEIGIGTIVGSALFNVLVIVGSIAIVRKAVLIWKPVLRDLIFYSISVILLLFAFWDKQIDIFEAFIFILFYIIYIITIVKWKKISPDSDTDDLKHFGNNTNTKYKWKIIIKPIDYIFDKLFSLSNQYYLVFFTSIVLIAGLCWILVYSAIEISGILHIPELIIALVVLAIGTSVPDMISSIIVARKGKGGMAFSNAVGSNVFDILIGLGIPWFFILIISGNNISVGNENILHSVMLLLASVLIVLILLIINKWRIGNKSGYFLISLYLLYIILEINGIRIF